MRIRAVIAVAGVSVLAVGISHADFRYTQQSKMTGGSLAGMTKSLAAFSKSAKQANGPQISTIMVRQNRMRRENPAGSVEITDLDGRRFIHIDPAHKTYWIQTFDQFKQEIQQATARAKEEQTKAVAKHDDTQNVTLVPKIDVQSTGQTRTILEVPAKEMKMRIDMLMQSTDPKTEADLEKSSSSFWMTADAWYGTIPGYEEVRQFYVKMSKELDWLPGSAGMGNPQMSEATKQLRASQIKMDGMPLVEFTSFGMAANGQAADSSAGSSAAPQNSQPQTSPTDNRTSTNPGDAIAKSLGGFLKKKQQQQPQPQGDNNAGTTSSGVPPPPPVPGSMMDVATEVTSYSRDSVDASLFDVPAGYTQMQPPASEAEKK